MKKSAINRQRGSIILPVVVSLLVGVLLLGGVQLGYYFFMKRELQNTADLAVLSGVQLLQDGASVEDGCNKAITAARANARQNFARHDELIDAQLSVVCGNWSESHAAPRHFAATVDADGFYNALYLSITYDALPFMPFSSEARIAVEAIAKKDFLPTAAFSVGPQLLRLNDGLLTNTLAAIGVNLDNTSVLDYKGLANVMITPAGLLEALGVEVPANLTVGDLQKLVSGEIGVKALVDVLETSIGVADGRGLLSVDQLNLLSLIKGGLAPLDLSLQLFSDATENGLFALIETPSEKINAALNTEVSLGSIVDLMLGVATQGNALALGGEDGKLIDLGILRVEAKLAVIEPPSIGIGGTGTKAHSANIRLFLRACLNLAGCKPISEQGSSSLLGLLGLKLDLPIVVELVNGTGTLGNMCHKTDPDGRQAAEITVETHVGDVCVGKFEPLSPDDDLNPFSFTKSCVKKMEEFPEKYQHELLKVELLGMKLVDLKTALKIPVLATEEKKDFYFHNPKFEPENIKNNTKWMPEAGNSLLVGTTIDKLVAELLNGLLGSGSFSNSGSAGSIEKNMANDIWARARQTHGLAPGASCNAGCREAVYDIALEEIRSGVRSLGGLIGNLIEGLGETLGGLLTLNIGGALEGVGKVVFGNGCYTGLLGLLPGGTENGCKDNLSDILAKKDGSGPSNALLFVLGLVTDLLKGPLDALGSQLLNPLLNALGLKVGQVETTLISLDCNDAAQLVY